MKNVILLLNVFRLKVVVSATVEKVTMEMVKIATISTSVTLAWMNCATKMHIVPTLLVHTSALVRLALKVMVRFVSLSTFVDWHKIQNAMLTLTARTMRTTTRVIVKAALVEMD